MVARESAALVGMLVARSFGVAAGIGLALMGVAMLFAM